MLPPRSISLPLAVVILLALPSGVAAQGPTQADSVLVSLWPEYDREDVLVIYRVSLPAGTPLPSTVRLLIPPDAPALTAAAFRSPDGGLLNADHVRGDGEQADTIDLVTEGTEVQIEFYLPLPTTGDLRQFSFTWPGGVASPRFGYEVQQPVGAQNVEIEPAPSRQTTDSLGLIYHQVDLGELSPDDRPEVSLSYAKTTPDLTAGSTTGGLAQPEPAPRASIDFVAALPWVLLVVGVGLIGGGLVYFFRNRAEERRARPRHRVSRPRAENDRVDASPVFCHNCGTQATSSDRFCRQCGTALRT